MQLLRSVLFTTCLFIGTLLYAVAVVALSWLPSAGRQALVVLALQGAAVLLLAVAPLWALGGL